MEDVDVVVHCAAALPLWSKEEIYSVNVEGTANLLKIASISGVERFVFISSTAVYGKNVKGTKEDAELSGVGEYGKSKIMAEKECISYRKKMIVPILRPKTFGGPMRLGVFQILCDWVMHKKNIPIVGTGENRYQLLHIDDLLDVIHIISTSDEEKVNETFNVGSAEFGTLKEDLEKLLQYAGTGKRVIPVPSKLIIPILRIFEKINISPLYEWVYETADKDHYVSVEKIMDRFNWRPKKSTADVWIDTYAWYVREHEKYEKNIGITHTSAWNQGVLYLFRSLF